MCRKKESLSNHTPLFPPTHPRQFETNLYLYNDPCCIIDFCVHPRLPLSLGHHFHFTQSASKPMVDHSNLEHWNLQLKDTFNAFRDICTLPKNANKSRWLWMCHISESLPATQSRLSVSPARNVKAA